MPDPILLSSLQAYNDVHKARRAVDLVGALQKLKVIGTGGDSPIDPDALRLALIDQAAEGKELNRAVKAAIADAKASLKETLRPVLERAAGKVQGAGAAVGVAHA